MKGHEFMALVKELRYRGYGDELEWQENLKPCSSASDFAAETVWVILNSGMREQIARIIKSRIYDALLDGADISTVFGHKGKVAAIKYVWDKYDILFADYLKAESKIEFLQTIPYIGKITCWHLAKSLGEDCVKPDRHLVRIAAGYDLTPDNLCEKISGETGYKKCTVDIVLWRSANLKLI